jgi:hypothetical protein
MGTPRLPFRAAFPRGGSLKNEIFVLCSKKPDPLEYKAPHQEGDGSDEPKYIASHFHKPDDCQVSVVKHIAAASFDLSSYLT